MDFDRINSLFGSPPRDGRRRQKQTCHTPRSSQKISKDDEEILLQVANTQGSYLPLSRGINHNLLSRISKFEALDALSTPINISSLRPAHLQISRQSISLKGTEICHRKRLPTIFSPSSETRDLCGRIDDDFTCEQDALADTKTRKWSSSKGAGLKKNREEHSSYESVNTRMRGGVWDTVTKAKAVGSVTSAYLQSETPSRKKMRDMIKIYDGSLDTIVQRGKSPLRNRSLTNGAV
jgi:hypothetical protein